MVYAPTADVKFAESLPRPGPLTQRQKEVIKASLPKLAEVGPTITRLTFGGLLDDHPGLMNILSHSKHETGLQSDALAGAIYLLGEHIDDFEEFMLPTVERIAHRHASLHITPSQYNAVEGYLMKGYEECFGKDVFVGELRDAWWSAYWNLAWMCMNREDQLYKAAGWVGFKNFTLVDRVQEADDIVSFYLKPEDGGLLTGAYKPGQYISVQQWVPEHNCYQQRQYSLSDSPSPDIFRITTKRERGIKVTKEDGSVDGTEYLHPGWVSNIMHDTLKVGDIVEVGWPFGEYWLDTTSKSPVVLISAGVGVTPVTAMLNNIVKPSVETEGSRPKREVSWIHAVRSAKDHAFKTHVQNIAAAHPDFIKTTIFYSDPTGATKGVDYDIEGRLDLTKVPTENLRLNAEDAQYYLCGPPQFMKDMAASLRTFGITDERIHAEMFGVGAAKI